MWTALTRPVSPSLERCELTHLQRTCIDIHRAQVQHAAYEAALEGLGCRLERLEALPEQPDAVFVEDTAVVLDELAVITRPGAASRRAETASVAAALARHRTVARLEQPAQLDGGDVLVVDRMVFVGLSSRSNAEGLDQLAALLGPAGYAVRGVEVDGCLHLKSAATTIGPGTLLLAPAWADGSAFAELDVVTIDPSEPFAANTVRVGDRLLAAAAFPKTQERLAQHGYDVTAVDVSELALAEGALTCCSLLLRPEAN